MAERYQFDMVNRDPNNIHDELTVRVLLCYVIDNACVTHGFSRIFIYVI